MEIEVGKFYRLRNGMEAIIYAKYEKENLLHGAVIGSRPSMFTWDLKGENGIYSIIGPWIEKHPAQDWPEQSVIEVRNSQTDPWRLRRFVMYCPEQKGAKFMTLSDDKGGFFYVEVSNDQKKWYLRRFYNVCLDSPFPIVTFNDGCTLTLSHSKYARLPNEN